MKVFLMARDYDFDIEQQFPSNEQDIIKDLELDILFSAMAKEDEFLLEVVRRGVLCSLKDKDTILYRQNILKDCLQNSSIVREIYSIATEAIAKEKKHHYGLFMNYPNSVLDRSVEVLKMFVEMLKKLNHLAKNNSYKFQSEGFIRFFEMLNKELSEEYFATIESHLKELELRNGVLISSVLGKGNKGINYVLRKQSEKKENWFKHVFYRNRNYYAFYISDRDENGYRALSELKDRGVSSIANAAAQSADHILSFFNMLRIELGFYVGCLNLQERLVQKGEPVTFPSITDLEIRNHSFNGLYDICLTLGVEQRVVGNDVNADNKELVIITGANQGGKSTFLRSIGQAQLMMQCGMYVPARYFCSNICSGIFTHFKREEDITMSSGKLDEELNRMNCIASIITSNSMLLFNESFAATNEREGSEIARQITCALLEKHIKIFFVTHFYEFANGLYERKINNAIFLRAERKNDGVRTFKMVEGEPLRTSFGADLYKKIFGEED